MLFDNLETIFRKINEYYGELKMNKKRCKGCGRYIESHKTCCYDSDCMIRQTEKALGVKLKTIDINSFMVEIEVVK